MYKIAFILILIILLSDGYSQDQSIPYTLADRDRLIQVEANVNGLRNEMTSLRSEMNSLRNEMTSLRNEVNARFETVNAKIDYVFWLLGVIFALMLFLLGFIIWDRRTTLAPVKNDVEELKRENEKMKDIFRKQAEKEPKFSEILKTAGML